MANDDSYLCRDHGIPLDLKDTNSMDSMLLSDDVFIKGKYMDSMLNINFTKNMTDNDGDFISDSGADGIIGVAPAH